MGKEEKKNSRNRSKPPSSDRMKKPPKRSRKSSGKKPEVKKVTKALPSKWSRLPTESSNIRSSAAAVAEAHCRKAQSLMSDAGKSSTFLLLR